MIKNWVDQMRIVNPIGLIASGLTLMGLSMAGFALVTWPDAFMGLIGTFAP